MNALERNCADAIRAYVLTGSPASTEDEQDLRKIAAAAAICARLPLASWDAEDDATMPRASIKAVQGEEVVWLYGAYALRVTIETTVKAKINRADALDGALQFLLSDAGALAVELTGDHFHCYGRAGGASRTVSNAEGKREMKMEFTLYGFDLDRFTNIPPLQLDPPSAVVGASPSGSTLVNATWIDANPTPSGVLATVVDETAAATIHTQTILPGTQFISFDVTAGRFGHIFRIHLINKSADVIAYTDSAPAQTDEITLVAP